MLAGTRVEHDGFVRCEHRQLPRTPREKSITSVLNHLELSAWYTMLYYIYIYIELDRLSTVLEVLT